MMRTPSILALALLSATALAGCEENTYRGNDRAAEEAEPAPAADVADAGKAVREADPGQVFPLPMTRDEYTKVVSGDGTCSFRMTSSDFPVLVFTRSDDAAGVGKAVMKVNGKLFELSSAGSSSDKILFAADGVRASVAPEDGEAESGEVESGEAALHFEVDGGEELGYWGYFGCGTNETGS